MPYAAQNVILAHFSRSVLGMKEKNIATNSSSVAVFVFNALMFLGNSVIVRINTHHGAKKSVTVFISRRKQYCAFVGGRLEQAVIYTY